MLGGSWVVISRVISPLIWIVTLLITPLITTYEPPSVPSLTMADHTSPRRLQRTFALGPQLLKPTPKAQNPTGLGFRVSNKKPTP